MLSGQDAPVASFAQMCYLYGFGYYCVRLAARGGGGGSVGVQGRKDGIFVSAPVILPKVGLSYPVHETEVFITYFLHSSKESAL